MAKAKKFQSVGERFSLSSEEWTNGETDAAGTLVSSSQTSADGLQRWSIAYRDLSTPVTNYSVTYPGTGRMEKTVAPGGSYTLNTYSYGLLASSAQDDSTGAQIGGTTYGYDAHGRQYQMTDARNGATTLGYNNADQVATNTTPDPGGGSEVTTTTYNNMMQATSVTQPDSTTVSSSYLLTGELGQQSGSRTYPVQYSYDYAGRMKTMTNWSGFSTLAGSRVTTWNYDSYRGWLTSKVYDDGHGPSYAYWPSGRLKTRTWVRGTTTTYNYNHGGDLTNVVYSDSTPGVTNSYDRLGRLGTVSWTNITDNLSYNLANELTGESFSGGSLAGLATTNYYDPYLRRTNLTSLNGTTTLAKAVYGYDSASRLSTVSDGTNNAAYTYLANSPLVSQILFKSNSVTRMTTAKTYDLLNRLTQVSSAPGASYTLPLAFNYTYNAANQRTHNTLADGSYWIYAYDSLGQVTNACKYFADGTAVAGQQFDYTFDTIGNRTQTQNGGTNGTSLHTAGYYANDLNQLTNRDVPAYVDILGASILTNGVSVNGTNAFRKQEYFWWETPASNSSSALWTNIIVSGGQSVTGNVYVAKQPEVFKYDADGNLTNDGRWAYTWDGENRLVGMTNNTGVGPQYKLTFAYDYKGRRIQKMVSTNSVGIYTNRFLYDGWNLVAEVNPASSLIRSYVWGTDLSGSMQGAGGVGGLLAMNTYSNSLLLTSSFYAYDGNGNVSGLINAADGTIAANYEYGPFGEPIRITGAMANNSPFLFSTKYYDSEPGLYYYGYRFYNPSTGTWPNKDPMQEAGGMNLYCMVNNDPVNNFDMLGLWGRPQHKALIEKWLQLNPAPNGQDWAHYKWHCIVLDVPALLMEGNDQVDGTGGQGLGALCDAQSTANSYQHSMRAWYEPVSSARSKRDAFVKGLESIAESRSADARMAISTGDTGLAGGLMENAVMLLGKAQHPLADETSPAHAGFQVWYGPVEGSILLTPLGWLLFVANHERRESPAVYNSLGDSPANTVAGQIHPELLFILRE